MISLDYIIYDTFTGAETDLADHTPEIGGGWTAINGGSAPANMEDGNVLGAVNQFNLSTTTVPADVAVYYEMVSAGSPVGANRMCATPVGIDSFAYGDCTFIADAFEDAGNWWVSVSVAGASGELDYQEIDTGIAATAASTLRVELAADRLAITVLFNGSTVYTDTFGAPLRANTYFTFAAGSDTTSVAVGEQ